MAKNNGNAATYRKPASGLTPQPRDTRTDKEAEDPEINSARKPDKVSNFFEEAPYHMSYAWAELKKNIRGADYFLTVSRYYPAQKTAVDLFYSEAEYKAGDTAAKRKGLNKMGIKYAFLAPKVSGHDGAATLADQLKDQ